MTEHIEEILDFIVNPATEEKVKAAFDSGKEITAIYSDINEYYHFRLLRVKPNIINLEFEIMCKFGVTYEIFAQFLNDGRIFLPYRFFKALTNRPVVDNPWAKNIFGFSILNNALIAAHSIESVLVIQFAKDAKKNINGLDMEFYKVEEGMLNIYAHDKYGLDPNKAIAIGISTSGTLTINPASVYEREYRNLADLKLLSSLKLI